MKHARAKFIRAGNKHVVTGCGKTDILSQGAENAILFAIAFLHVTFYATQFISSVETMYDLQFPLKMKSLLQKP
jgi:hypothetical protein